MLEILLVFMMNGEDLTVSKREFESYQECETFVNSLVNQDVVNSDFTFQFSTPDAGQFIGQCIERSEYKRYVK